MRYFDFISELKDNEKLKTFIGVKNTNGLITPLKGIMLVLS